MRVESKNETLGQKRELGVPPAALGGPEYVDPARPRN